MKIAENTIEINKKKGFDSVRVDFFNEEGFLVFLKKLVKAKVNFTITRWGIEEAEIDIESVRHNNKSWIRNFLKKEVGLILKDVD